MKTIATGFLRKLTLLSVVILSACLGRAFANGELELASLRTTASTYNNVRVFNLTKTHLSFAHEGGTAVIKLADIEPESLAALERARLGVVPGDATTNSESDATKSPAVTASVGRSLALPAPVSSLFSKFSFKNLVKSVGVRFLAALMAGLLVAWFFSAFCCALICKKAGHAPGFLVWLPVLQLFPMLRAAGMSGWWFFAWGVPLLNIVAQVLWCVKITQARGKGFLTAVLLILPVTNLLAFLYLAFSNGAKHEETSDETSAVGRVRALPA